MNRALSPDIKIIEQLHLPQVELTHLNNGVPLYSINSGEQEVVKMELMFRAGKWYEPKNLIADFTNRMLREGTSTKSAKEIADTFDYHGANIQYSAAFENAGVTLFSLTNKAETLLPLLYEILTDAVFPQGELDTVLNNRKQRLKVELEKNDFVANRQFVDALYGQKHPYGRITRFEDFNHITVDDLKGFYKQYYNAANLTIIVSGRFTDSLIQSINKTFGGNEWKREAADTSIVHPVESSTQLIQHTDKADSVQSAIMLGNLSINKNHPDFLKLSVLNTVFGGYFGSRLMTNIREEKGYTYGIHSSFVSYPHGGFIEISSEVGTDVREATLQEIAFEINRLRTELVDKEELEIVKNYLAGKIMRSIDGALKFSDTLKGLIIYNHNTDYINLMLKTVQTVTAEELRELAVKYLDYDKMYKITVG
jgi:predicted Zn-dependent peptidase